jgi:mannose-6-phosphate isomerase class I
MSSTPEMDLSLYPCESLLKSFGLYSCDSFFMNLMELKKGEGMYVGADGPHAWLKGDIVELMAVR